MKVMKSMRYTLSSKYWTEQTIISKINIRTEAAMMEKKKHTVERTENLESKLFIYGLFFPYWERKEKISQQ